jgi:hypothetical protein
MVRVLRVHAVNFNVHGTNMGRLAVNILFLFKFLLRYAGFQRTDKSLTLEEQRIGDCSENVIAPQFRSG